MTLKVVANAIANRWRRGLESDWDVGKIVDRYGDELDAGETVWGALGMTPICIFKAPPRHGQTGKSPSLLQSRADTGSPFPPVADSLAVISDSQEEPDILEIPRLRMIKEVTARTGSPSHLGRG
jgi:hypothetical protein